MTNFMQGFGGDFGEKYMARFFRRADDVVWDLSTGRVGVQTEDGSIATIDGSGDDAQIQINMMDQFGFGIPAFAQNTPISQVSIGDLIFFGKRSTPGWIVDRRNGIKPVGSSTPKAPRAKGPVAAAVEEIPSGNTSFTIMKTDGTRSTWVPPKVSLLGMGDNGVMVIRSLLNMNGGGALQGMQSNLMPLLLLGGGDGDLDMEKLVPFMLMSSMGGATAADGSQQANPFGGNMLQTIMMMKLLGGDGGGLFGKKKIGNGGKSPFQG